MSNTVNVYDFDGTLYQGDSTADFFKWCIRRYPRTLSSLPLTAIMAAGCFGLHIVPKTQFKGALYKFLRVIPDIETEVKQFWRAHQHKIGGPCHPSPGDIVISAGPEFLLHEVCAQRKLALIASLVDPHTGATLSPNCSNEEKVVRFCASYPNAVIGEFYSDSHNDDPLAALAQKAFMVDIPQKTLTPWTFEDDRKEP